jgi:hypothetical protein
MTLKFPLKIPHMFSGESPIFFPAEKMAPRRLQDQRNGVGRRMDALQKVSPLVPGFSVGKIWI